MTVILHHLDQSRSQRVLWLLEELEVPYEIVMHKRGPDFRAPKSLREIHPVGKAPVIEDDGKAIAESGAIVEYLIKKYGNGKFVPQPERQLDDSFWSHFAEGSLMPTLVMKLVFTLIPNRSPFLIRPLVRSICSGVTTAMVDPDAKNKMSFVADHIKKNPGWFAGGDSEGNPTAADFQMLFPLEAASAGRVPDMAPEIKAWVENAHARPAYKRALEKGGPYNYA
ncbi:hypothetical protein CF319_g5740 [Tilletia indica]|uniref:glutathione transferase n=2 Tax=Tilletia TaxID=13289 RepID=A0A8X7N8F7_9BASI|nr:hypothetical protein CF327_g4842 [Tilletia walkeri]KAE8220790.1 hypothetical protein CF319_g5740 [Tilletia indica]KAE8234193.1 hypothetical protein CF326_g761 [Tilletia indica]KAE8243649.1 hypothetical protein A4X13_0g7000 [Tilletia indica]KAE8269092.1 hypothetical protein A4X09_0g3255 [Tilletia walkeri]